MGNAIYEGSQRTNETESRYAKNRICPEPGEVESCRSIPAESSRLSWELEEGLVKRYEAPHVLFEIHPPAAPVFFGSRNLASFLPPPDRLRADANNLRRLRHRQSMVFFNLFDFHLALHACHAESHPMLDILSQRLTNNVKQVLYQRELTS